MLFTHSGVTKAPVHVKSCSLAQGLCSNPFCCSCDKFVLTFCIFRCQEQFWTITSMDLAEVFFFSVFISFFLHAVIYTEVFLNNTITIVQHYCPGRNHNIIISWRLRWNLFPNAVIIVLVIVIDIVYLSGFCCFKTSFLPPLTETRLFQDDLWGNAIFLKEANAISVELRKKVWASWIEFFGWRKYYCYCCCCCCCCRFSSSSYFSRRPSTLLFPPTSSAVTSAKKQDPSLARSSLSSLKILRTVQPTIGALINSGLLLVFNLNTCIKLSLHV